MRLVPASRPKLGSVVLSEPHKPNLQRTTVLEAPAYVSDALRCEIECDHVSVNATDSPTDLEWAHTAS